MATSQALKDLSIKLSTPTKSPADTVNSGTPEDAAGKLSKFNAALNVALDQARQQRKDTTMDFMGGVVPKGALPATSFAGVLSAFNSASAPLEATLVDGAMSFAQKQMQVSIDAKNNIRDLALKVAENGGGPETLASVLSFAESGDIDGAIKAAGAALAAKTEGKTKAVGNNLVRENADGTSTVLYSTGKEVGYDDLSDMKPGKFKAHLKAAMEPAFYASLDRQLNDGEMRQFYEFWMALNNQNKQTTRADIAYKQWQAAVAAAGASAGIEKAETTTKKKEPEDDVFSVTGI